jgi:hypothetical protein
MKYLVLHVNVFRQKKLPEFQIFGIDPKVFIDIFGQS